MGSLLKILILLFVCFLVLRTTGYWFYIKAYFMKCPYCQKHGGLKITDYERYLDNAINTYESVQFSCHKCGEVFKDTSEGRILYDKNQ